MKMEDNNNNINNNANLTKGSHQNINQPNRTTMIESSSQTQSTATAKEIEIEKHIKQFMNSKRISPKKRFISVTFFIILLLNLVCWALQGIFLLSFSNQTKKVNDALVSLYLREYWKNNLVLEAPIDILAHYGWANVGEVPRWYEISHGIINTLSKYIIRYNNDLKRDLHHLSDNIKDKFYERNIQIREFNTKTRQLENLHIVDGFEAYDQLSLGNMYLRNAISNFNNVPLEPLEKYGFFSITNGLNDLLISHDNLASMLQKEFQNELDSTKTLLLTILIIAFCLTGIYWFFAIYIYVSMKNEYEYFMEILFMSDFNKSLIVESNVKSFLSILKNHNDDYEIIKAIIKIEEVKDNAMKQRRLIEKKQRYTARKRHILRKANMTNNTISLKLFIFRIVPISIIVGAAMLAYFMLSDDQVKQIENKQNEISTTLNRITLQGLIGVENMVIGLTNGTFHVRNAPVIEDYEKNVKLMSKINDILDSFRDSNGQLSPSEREVFYNISCQKVYSPRFTEYLSRQIIVEGSCLEIYKEGWASLADMMSKLAQYTHNFLNEFQLPPLTLDKIKKLLSTVNGEWLSTLDPTNSLMLILFDMTLNDYVKFKDDADTFAIIFTSISVIIGVFIAVFMQLFFLRQFLDKELERKRVLGIVPLNLLVENKLLKKYVVEHSYGTLGNAKHLL